MKPRIFYVLTLAIIAFANGLQAQTTAFTYQGRLNDGASPANGSYDVRFILYDSSAGGSQQGPILTNSGTAVANGVFTATLDFGNQFPGGDRWLEIAVRTNGLGGFSTLSPRQQVGPTPYAIFANEASNLLGTVTLPQLPAAVVTSNGAGLVTVGSLNVTGTTASAISSGGTNLLYFDGKNNFFSGLGSGNGSLTGSNNTAYGDQALSHDTTAINNTAIGYLALQNNTTGPRNTAVGSGALQDNISSQNNIAVGYNSLVSNLVGNGNVAIGYQALLDNTNGGQNTAIGTQALELNISSSGNTAVGFDALFANTVGNNTALGYQAAFANTTGGANVASGYEALMDNTTGGGNTANGSQALQVNTTGIQNTAIGNSALLNNLTGSNNIALGYQAGFGLTNGSTNIYIGNLEGTNESNTIRIGSAGNHTRTFIAGIIGASVTNASPVMISPSGQLGSAGTIGLTTNIAVLVPGGTTNILVFANGILQAVQ